VIGAPARNALEAYFQRHGFDRSHKAFDMIEKAFSE
jgi:hypothetical protein